MDISVIIPAYNEQDFIAQTLISIYKYIPKEYEFEIFVVDHGSLDNTRNIATANGAVVIDGSGAKTISALRNLGLGAATGRYVIFLDSDTTLTSQWAGNLNSALARLEKNPKLILGSKRTIPNDASWVSRVWFGGVSSVEEYQPTHLGGGHIIATKQFVLNIGGFPEHMETGEDFEFCQIAKNNGAQIISDPKLKAVHNGVPGSIAEFFKRERWHGRGDFSSFSVFLSSKVALLSVAFAIANGVLLKFFLFGEWVGALIALSVIVVLCYGSALVKLKVSSLAGSIQGTFLFYLYYFARALSGIGVLLNGDVKKVNRAAR